MSDIKKIMRLDVENLRTEQFKALQVHAVSVLKDMIILIETKDWENARAMTQDSPAGDGMGLNSTYIDFDVQRSNNSNLTEDIGWIIDLLESLEPSEEE